MYGGSLESSQLLSNCHSRDIAQAYSAPTTRGQDRKLWSVSECRACGHQFMDPQPSWDELQPYYNEGYDPYDPMHGSEVGDAEAIREAMETGLFRHIPLPTGKRLLDVGCGAGWFVRISENLGAIAQGVEPSEYAASLAQKQGLNVCSNIQFEIRRYHVEPRHRTCSQPC